MTCVRYNVVNLDITISLVKDVIYSFNKHEIIEINIWKDAATAVDS